MVPPNVLTELEQRFIRYVRIDTQSKDNAPDFPSTPGQWELLRLLADELRHLGAHDVTLTQWGYVLATIPATAPAPDLPTVALLAHVDTAPDYPGGNVRPIVHRNYRGGPIVLPDDPRQVLNWENAPELRDKIGEDIITASGTTLLGADDKAGVAVLMTLAACLLADPHIPHPRIRLCFTPDEEVGRGVDHLSLDELAANVAYTLDGEGAGEIVYENFCADRAIVTITGVAIHPGSAKGRMVNAVRLATQLAEMLPRDHDTPETTEGREGYIHLHDIRGNVAQVQLRILLRDFEEEGLRARAELVRSLCEQIQRVEPRARVECVIERQYRNMRYWLEKDMRPVQLAEEAIRRAGLRPVSVPTRGGTDGARLTECGLPTPNLFVGTHNPHGPTEWISLQDMARSWETCLHLVQLWAEHGHGYQGWQGA
ncbi:MAG: peptidase T [Anaerolineae bacterium]|nr:peptidase T [Anaerolineae bacterium]